MNPAPASVASQHAPGPGRVIGLFLARLLACLLRLRASGETIAPSYIAHMVTSAEDMVHAYICNLAALRLKTAGYTHAARALRTTRADRRPTTHAEPVSPEDLIARLEDTITTFNEAEALSVHFARLVFCALCMIFAGETPPVLPIIARDENTRPASGQSGQAPHPWPPPPRQATANLRAA